MKEVILIAVAMKNELDIFINNVDSFKEIQRNNVLFYEGKLFSKDVVCMLTGVGTINTAYAMGIAYANYNIQFVINYGIAGGIGKDIHKKQMLVIKDCFNVSSYRTSEKENKVDTCSLEYLTFVDNDIDKLTMYNSDEYLLNKLQSVIPNLAQVRCGSGDVWNREKDVILNLRDNYSVAVSDMECVALYQICNKLHLPIISLKIISDNTLLSEEYDRNVLSNNINEIVYAIRTLIDN